MPDPASYDVFLSHHSADKDAVEALARRLEDDARLAPFLDKWHLIPGNPWQEELEQALDASRTCAVFIGPHGMGPWQNPEMQSALDDRVKRPGFRVIPVLLPEARLPERGTLPRFLANLTWVDFRSGGLQDAEAFRRLVAGIHGHPPGRGASGTTVLGPSVCPYQGLAVFDETEARFFFGREAEIQHLLEQFRTQRFLAVVGPSGSGKSSIVRAGVLPQLRQGAVPGSAAWTYLVCRPGAHPLEELSVGLARLTPQATIAGLCDSLAADERELHLHTRVLLQPQPAARLCLVIDQFEEVFTLCQEQSERIAFIDALRYAATAAGGQSVILLTIRADFLTRAAEYKPLAELLSAHQFLLGPMDRDDLRRACEAPAQSVGLTLEDGLTDAILDDVGREPGLLPLMQDALLQLWERRHPDQGMTLQAYHELGGVRGALAQKADTLFTSLSLPQQTITRWVFLRLTRPGEGTEDTRRRATFAEVGDSVRPVAQVLADARLLVTGRDQATGEETLEVAHEALIRHWERLRGWLDQDREFLLWHQRLRGATIQWERTGHDAGVLLRGAPLAEAARWLAVRPEDLAPAEQEFIQKSRALRARRRLYTQVTVSLVVLFVILGGLIWWRWQEAQQQRKTALSRGLALQAISLTRGPYDLALLLSLASNRLTHIPEGKGSLLEVLESNPHPITYLRGHKGPVQSVAFSPNGRLLASASFDGTIILWDVATHQQRNQLSDHTTKVYSVAFSSDGQLLASGDADGTIILWDVAMHRSLARLRGHSGEVRRVAFSPDGQMLASSSQDRSVILWDVATRQMLVQPLAGHTALVGSLAFSSDGQTLASGDDAGHIILWDVANRQQLDRHLTSHTGPVTSITFSRDGQTLVSGSGDRTILLWDVTRPQEPKPLARFRAHIASVMSVALSPDGQTLASGGQEGSVMSWDFADRKRRGEPLNGHANAVRSVAFSPNGQLLASGGDDHTVILWNISARQRLGQPLIGSRNGVFSVAFSPNGQLLASGGDDHEVNLWNVASRGLSQRLHGHTAPVRSVAFSQDGQKLASSDMNGTIMLWDISLDPLRGQPLMGHGDEVFSVAFSPDGRILASGDKHGTILLWDVGPPGATIGTPQVLDRLHGHTAPVRSVAFSHDGKWLAAGSFDRTVRIWNVASREEAVVLRDNQLAWVHAIAFSANGQTLALGGSPSTLILWDVTTAIKRQQLGWLLSGHTTEVLSVAFTRDGQLLASGSKDGTTSLWDVPKGQRLGQPLVGHDDAVHSVAFSPNSNMLASGGSDHAIMLWDVSFDSWQARACQIANRNLTCEEWERYLERDLGKVPYGKLCPNLPGPEYC